MADSCIYGKSHRLKFGIRERATKPGELTHTDVWSPFQYSLSGYWIFVLFNDDFFSDSEIYFMKQRSEVAEKLKLFLAESGTAGKVVNEVLSDNRSEFDNGKMIYSLRLTPEKMETIIWQDLTKLKVAYKTKRKYNFQYSIMRLSCISVLYIKILKTLW